METKPMSKYEIKNGKIYISKTNFRKVHKDYKNSTKGKERMLALDPESGATTSYEVVFGEDWQSARGDVVTGDTIRFTESVWGGSYRKPRHLGSRTVEAEVLNDSYGVDKQQHTFTLRVISSTGLDALEAGKTIRRKGRNIYRGEPERLQWSDESERQLAAAEKHQRGDIARAARDERRALEIA
tara:strand:- start:101 stop:652 length:552 start_codon:yes stop_codon:yes gene_type:complete